MVKASFETICWNPASARARRCLLAILWNCERNDVSFCFPSRFSRSDLHRNKLLRAISAYTRALIHHAPEVSRPGLIHYLSASQHCVSRPKTEGRFREGMQQSNRIPLEQLAFLQTVFFIRASFPTTCPRHGYIRIYLRIYMKSSWFFRKKVYRLLLMCTE